MKCLFKQLSKEHQDEIIRRQDSHLLISLKAKTHRHQLTILDMMNLSDDLGVGFGILEVTKLFES